MIKELQLVPINNENDSREMGGALGLFANFADCEVNRERDKPKNKTDQVYALIKNVNSHEKSISQRLYFLKAKASLISIMDLIADFQGEKKVLNMYIDWMLASKIPPCQRHQGNELL